MTQAATTRGRPSSFKPEFVEQGRALAELGATDREIAEFFEVDERTIYRWLNEKLDFCQALKLGKDLADERVVRSLYRRAVGYSFDAVKIYADPKSGAEVAVPYVEHVPPDVTACIFWLKNRRRAEWRDKVEHEHGGVIGHSVTVYVPETDRDPTAEGTAGEVPPKPG